MADYQKDKIKLVCKGMMSSFPSDILPDGFFHYLENIRIHDEGYIRSRPNATIVGNLNPVTSDSIHDIRKLIDKSSALYTYVVCAGTKLYSGLLANPNLIESGFSGNKLSIVEFRPEESVPSYLYLSDENKFRRVGVDNLSFPVGIDPPLSPVIIEIDKPQRKVIDEIGAGTIASWNNGGVAGATSNQSRINTTITAILLDGAVPNFCSIIPVAFHAAIQQGVNLSINGTETITIEEVIAGSINAGVCTIASIKYETGVTGKCTIDLSVPIKSLKYGSILYINSSEYVRVLEVITGANDSISVKVLSVGTLTVGNTIVGVSSFRTYITNNHIAGETLITDCGKSSMSGVGIGTLTKTGNFDLSFVNSRGLSLKDYFHLSLLANDISQIDEIQIQLDCDETTNDFLHNWFYYSLRGPDLLASAELTSATLTVQQQVINRQQIDELFTGIRGSRLIDNGFDANITNISDNSELLQNLQSSLVPTTSSELGIGDSQWTEVLIPFEKFIKGGSDSSRGFKDIKAIRISIKTKGAVDIYFDSIWIGGGYEVSSLNNEGKVIPIRYMARYRESKTKTISNWSPINREGVTSFRSRHLLSIPVSADTRVDVIDFARIGGNLTDFKIIGTKPNDSSKFIDDISDFTALDNPKALRPTSANNLGDRDFYKPFAILDKPKKGICNVIGNILVRVSGDNLNTSYPLGTRIIVNNTLTRFYTQPVSTSQVELEDNLGTLTNVPFEIKEPLLTGQTLPILVGVFGLGITGLIIFGAGDINAAGTIYWLDGNSADTMSDTNKLEITPPSEPIIGGCMYYGYPFFWTTKRCYILTPTFTDTGYLSFRAREVANSTGLANRATICVSGNYIYYLRKDLTGIDRVQGEGNPQSITNGVIENFFINSGIVPSQYLPHPNLSISVPNFSLLNSQQLINAGGYIFWIFYDTDGSRQALIYDEKAERWLGKETFQYGIGTVAEDDGEGSYINLIGLTGIICKYDYDGTFDTTKRSIFLTPSRTQGEDRFLKEYKEIIIDLIRGPSSKSFELTPSFNTNSVVDPVLTINGNDNNVDRELYIYNISRKFRSISSVFSWIIDKYKKFYALEFSYLPKVEVINNRGTDLDIAGVFGNKFFQAITIKANTYGVDKTLNFYDENGTLVDIIIINHNTESIKTYAFQNPFITHAVRFVSNDNINWEQFDYQYVFDKEPELAKIWEGQENNYGTPNIKQAKKIYITHRSTVDIVLKLKLGNGIIDEYPIPHSNGIRIETELFLKPRKWKLLRPRLESDADFQLYKNGCKLFITDLTTESDYIITNPFGDDSNVTDVRA
jgi:hypothetical protein